MTEAMTPHQEHTEIQNLRLRVEHLQADKAILTRQNRGLTACVLAIIFAMLIYSALRIAKGTTDSLSCTELADLCQSRGGAIFQGERLQCEQTMRRKGCL